MESPCWGKEPYICTGQAYAMYTVFFCISDTLNLTAQPARGCHMTVRFMTRRCIYTLVDNECLIFFKAWMIDEEDSENYWKLMDQKWQMVSNCLLLVTFPHMCLCLAVTLIKSCCPAWDTAGPGDVSVSDHHYRYMSSVVVGLTAQWK